MNPRNENKILVAGYITATNATQAIHQFTEDWPAATKAKDINRLIDMVTDDVVFLPAGLPPIRGKEAVRGMYQN